MEVFAAHPFFQLAALLLMAAVAGGVAVRLRQPLIIAYILVGITAGLPSVGLAAEREHLELLATLGISVLLFLVGLKLDLDLIKVNGPVALTTGIGQVVFTSVVGFLLCWALGLELLPSAYVAVALTFSSTIIIVKLLSDKREIDSLHGRIAVGFLIVQDILAIIALIALTSVGPAGAGDPAGDAGSELAWRAIRGITFIAAIALFSRFLLGRLLDQFAASTELLVLFAIAWAVGLAATGEYLGFSKEVGAFAAGVAMASTPYRESIGSRLTGLRDFLLLFFFVVLGSGLDLDSITAHLGLSIILSVFVLIGNPLIVMIIMGVMGYRKRTGFLTGLTVAQISEFSFVLVTLGQSLGHLDANITGLVTMVGFITIGLSTYLIIYSHPVYERISRWLGVFERHIPHREQAGEQDSPEAPYSIILFGIGRFGGNLVRELQQKGERIMGVDFDPEVVRNWRKEGLSAHYGDAEDPEFAATLPLSQVKWVISTVPSLQLNLTLLDTLRKEGYHGSVALTTHSEEEVPKLKGLSANLVVLPYEQAAQRTAERLCAA